MTLPNLLTFFRVTAVPVLVGLILEGKREAAFYLFLACGVSDAADGLLARLLDQRTLFGTYLDPVADKFLLGLSTLVLTAKGEIPLWVAVVVLGRDFVIVTGFMILRASCYRPRVEPSPLGKVTTAVEVLFILSVLSGPFSPVLPSIRGPLMALVVVLTCASGVQYVLRGARMLEKGGQGCPPS